MSATIADARIVARVRGSGNAVRSDREHCRAHAASPAGVVICPSPPLGRLRCRMPCHVVAVAGVATPDAVMAPARLASEKLAEVATPDVESGHRVHACHRVARERHCRRCPLASVAPRMLAVLLPEHSSWPHCASASKGHGCPADWIAKPSCTSLCLRDFANAIPAARA